jgi:hypothetical protein
MKKHLHTFFCSLLFSGLALTAQAQITVTRSDFANVGDFTANAYDTVLAGVSPGNAGASQTWDFSNLQVHTIDTNYFVAPASTPYASAFTSANIAVYNSLDSTYAFVDANVNLLNIVGYVVPNAFTGTPVTLSFSPPVTQITFPSTMGTTFNVTNATGQSTFYYSDTYLTFTFDSVRTTTTTNRASIVDGWGTTITPAGSFSTLRQRISEITSIAIEVYVVSPALGWQPVPLGQADTTIQYYYIANGQSWPVAQVETNNSGAVTSAQYLMNVVGMAELSAVNKDLNIYPNPSAGEFNVSRLNSKAAMLTVLDINGNEVDRINIDNSLQSFSMSSYPSGIYLFRVLDKAGAVISGGKLAVQK